jgi:hypothetical protein
MPKMRHFMAAAAFAAFALPAAAQETDPVLAYGPGDESRHAEAPPFRTLWERYPIDALEESFAVGIATGHPDMPEFTATPEQLAAILDYIASLQP